MEKYFLDKNRSGIVSCGTQFLTQELYVERNRLDSCIIVRFNFQNIRRKRYPGVVVSDGYSAYRSWTENTRNRSHREEGAEMWEYFADVLKALP